MKSVLKNLIKGAKSLVRRKNNTCELIYEEIKRDSELYLKQKNLPKKD